MPTAPQFRSVTPYLYYPDGDAAAAWLARAFGFGPARCVRDDAGAWAEGEVRIGPARIDISGGKAPEPGTGEGVLLIVGVEDVDGLYRHVSDAGIAIEPPRDEAYGPRSCHVTDPWGYRWYFWQGGARY